MLKGNKWQSKIFTKLLANKSINFDAFMKRYNLGDLAIVSISPSVIAAQKIEEAKWIPHTLLVAANIFENNDKLEIVESKIRHYIDHNKASMIDWLRFNFSEHQKLFSHSVNIGNQLIAAYEAGLRTLVVPAIWPEMERCARDVLDDFDGNPIEKVISKIEDTPISRVSSIFHGIFIIDEQVMQSIGKDEDNVPYVLNRHASVHGLRTYETERDCLNAIMLLDIFMEICSVLKHK